MANPNPNEAAPTSGQIEGEGSRTAARRYNAGVERTVASGRVDELGKEAEEALDGEEGDELRQAEAEGRDRGDDLPEDERPTKRDLDEDDE